MTCSPGFSTYSSLRGGRPTSRSRRLNLSASAIGKCHPWRIARTRSPKHNAAPTIAVAPAGNCSLSPITTTAAPRSAATGRACGQETARPVLMVKQSAHGEYRRVLVPVDFSRWSAPSLEIAKAVAPNAHFILLHSVEVPFGGKLRYAGVQTSVIDRYRVDALDEAMRRLMELAAGAGLRNTQWTPLTPTGLDAWMHIADDEQAQDCDLTVIGKHGTNAMEDLLLGITTNMVIEQGTSDVLVSTLAAV